MNWRSIADRVWWIGHDLYVGMRVITLLFAAVGVYHVFTLAKDHGFVPSVDNAQIAAIDYPDNFTDVPTYKPKSGRK